jgi:hypothetical protein
VQNHRTLPAMPEIETPTETSVPRTPWHLEVGQLLSRAAELCIAHGLDVDSFMKAAWSAYVESRPGMREELEEQQLREQLDELRKLGRLGVA